MLTSRPISTKALIDVYTQYLTNTLFLVFSPLKMMPCGQVWYHTPVILATWKVKPEGSLELRHLRLGW